jgi:hypothetical protein
VVGVPEVVPDFDGVTDGVCVSVDVGLGLVVTGGVLDALAVMVAAVE